MGPKIGAIMMPTPQAAMAVPRCRSGKISHMMACESGIRGPPPRPCSMRATSSVSMLGASPQSIEASVNRTVHARNSRLRPSTPASQPVAGRMMALAAR
jgi:hypothetical protein